MESVLAASSVQRDEPRSLHALRTAGRAVVEQGVDPGSPQQRVLCQVFRVIFMKTGLPSFRLPEQAVRAASASRIALLFDLPRFTVADARTELVPPRPKLAEPDFEVFRAAFVPADVLRPYDQVGDLVQFSVLVAVAAVGRLRSIFFASRSVSAHRHGVFAPLPEAVEESPDDH